MMVRQSLKILACAWIRKNVLEASSYFNARKHKKGVVREQLNSKPTVLRTDW